MGKFGKLALASLIGVSVGRTFADDISPYTARVATERGDITWSTASHWANGYVPCSIDDLVSLVPTNGVRSNYSRWKMPSDSQAIGAVLDTPGNINLTLAQSQRSAPVVLKTTTLAGFTNAYHAIGNDALVNFRPRTGFEFVGYAGGPSYMPKVCNGWSPWFAVSEGARAVIDEIENEGVFVKAGAGELEITEPVGVATACYGQGGTLTLCGGTSAVVNSDAPAAGAALHLDADKISAADTCVVDGRTTVTNWADCAGGPVKANRAGLSGYYAMSSVPWIAETQAFGHKLVDFGPMRNLRESDGGYGPSGALRFSQKIKNVREYFAVYQETAKLPSTSSSAYCAIGLMDNYPFMNSPGNDIYTSYAAYCRPIGDLRLNGERINWEYCRVSQTNLCVVSESIPESFSVNAGCAFDTIGLERNVSCGGFRAGEFLVYTNRLTEAERAQTIAYLMKKWVTGAATAETAAWTIGGVKGTNTALCVKAGETASVMSWSDVAARPTFHKTGAGTLVVDTVEPSNATVAVQDGKVKFVSVREEVPATPQAASNPAYRFDASAADVFTYTGGADDAGNKYVSAWAASEGGISANVPPTDGTVVNISKPVVIAKGGETGLDVVDFGTTSTNGPRAIFSAAKTVREAFVVLKMRSHDSLFKYNQYAGGLALPFSLDSYFGFPNRYADCLQDLNFATPATAGALWTVDGMRIDPFSADFGTCFSRGTDSFHVYHVAFSLDAKMLAFARDYHYQGAYYYTGGGLVVGEAIGYARRLTDSERRNTEAYLLAKWTTKTHPGRTAFSGVLDFTGNAAAEIATDRPLSLNAVSGATGLTKTGTGAVTVRRMSGPTAVTVSDGSLTAFVDPFEDAAFHLDASVADSVVFRAGQEADKRIDRWMDCRLNGRYAATPMLASGVDYGGLTNAVLRTSDGTDGLAAGSAYVDFLDTQAGNNTLNVVSGMKLYGADGAGSPVDVREVHAVFRVQGGNAAFIGNTVGTKSTGLVPRGDATEIWWSLCSYARDSVKRSDGSDWYDANYFRADKKSAANAFIVLSVQLRGEAVPAEFIAIDRPNCGRGGIKMCELMIFSDATNTTARAEAIHAYLQKKWKAVGDGTPAELPASLNVAAGSSLALQSATGAFALNEGANLACDITAEGACGLTTLAGAVTLPATAHVTVRVPAGQKVAAGRYRILAASSLVATANVANWTVALEGTTHYHVSLVADGTSVYAVLSQPGFTMLVR